MIVVPVFAPRMNWNARLIFTLLVATSGTISEVVRELDCASEISRLAGVSHTVLPINTFEAIGGNALTADEAFLTSTSLCVCPVRSIDGAPFEGSIPGPITRKIMDAFAERAEFDYVGQYLSFLGGGANAGI